MKKLVMTAALVACAAVVTAQTVTSANIVGYSKTALDAGMFDIVAPQFVQSTTDGMTISEAYQGQADLSKAYIWTGGGYNTLTFFGGDWYQGSTVVNDFLIGSGTALWLEGAAAGSAITSGEVPTADSIDVAVVVGSNLIANPYPTALTLGSLQVTDLDAIYVWTGGGYLKYLFFGGDWYLGSVVSNAVQIPVGTGFWFETTVAGSITFNKLY